MTLYYLTMTICNTELIDSNIRENFWANDCGILVCFCDLLDIASSFRFHRNFELCIRIRCVITTILFFLVPAVLIRREWIRLAHNFLWCLSYGWNNIDTATTVVVGIFFNWWKWILIGLLERAIVKTILCVRIEIAIVISNIVVVVIHHSIQQLWIVYIYVIWSVFLPLITTCRFAAHQLQYIIQTN